MTKNIVAGIVAHVDAGKTTLSEGLLYRAGAVRELGRVDKATTFLDSAALEKQRGITIFSHQASLQYDDLALTLLDTPGHVDFASQTEQVLAVLDVAVLVVSATDGISGYTRTLWRLLDRYQVPVVLFVNKMDAPGTDQHALLAQLQAGFSAGCVPLPATGDLDEATQEAVAMQDDQVLADYLTTGTVMADAVRQLVAKRRVFPVYFGSALHLTGIDDLLAGLARWTTPQPTQSAFGAKVFKISYDEKGERLTWLRVTGGTLHAKDKVLGTQQANELRVYNGAKYRAVPALTAGTVGAIPALQDTHQGQGLGVTPAALPPVLQPVLTFRVDPGENDVHTVLTALRQLADEDPQLAVTWSEELQECRVQLMGTVQEEILQQRLVTDFDLAVTFSAGSILYQETITQPMEGVGHFEPLRHYAEVHLQLTPGARGSGLVIDADCPIDVLGKNWQHQVLANLHAKPQLGVLIGAPLTDTHITLVTGRASNVHTVGGDFREATWRALRQGLMMLRVRGACQLLEPWYDFRLVVPQAQMGRAMTDIQRLAGTMADGETTPDATGMVTLTGQAPVATMQTYAQTVNAYTHGDGQLECVVAGYQPCHDAATVIAAAAYDPVGDLANTPGSVFCAHGAGYPVHWDEVPQTAHVPYVTPPAMV